MLSVNLNKVALVRNARGGDHPNLIAAARIAIRAGAGGITVHPRADGRHVRHEDLEALAAMPEIRDGRIELNVEGDLRPDLLDALERIRPAQFTVVPVTTVTELTTTRGWTAADGQSELRNAVQRLGGRTRISVFVDVEPNGIRLASDAGAHAVELHTRDYAEAFGTPRGDAILGEIRAMTDLARSLGLRVNAGHDLTPANLGPLIDAIAPDEVSIGHALVSDAVLRGLAGATEEYMQALGGAPQTGEPKYLIFHLVRHTESFYAQTPDEESKSQIEVNDFIRSWYPKVRQMIGAHAMGMAGEWDWMGVFGVSELSDWEAFREEYKRRFPGRTEKNLSMPGVGHQEFVRATDHVEHYRLLREMGVFPGQAEIDDAEKS